MTSRLLPLLALLNLLACAGSAKSPSSGAGGAGVDRCNSDQQCPGNATCLAGSCVPRAGAIPGWAIEVRPSDYGTAAITERMGVASGDFVADHSVNVTVQFVATVDSPVPTTANVVVSIPSAIPGRPDLTFETGTSTAPNPAQLALPTSALSRGAIVRLIPAPPADAQSPPLTFVIQPQASNSVKLMMPSDNRWIRGTLHDAVDDVPEHPYVARAYQMGRLVSNVPVIAQRSVANQTPVADGSFSLTVPADVASKPITIELAPQGPAVLDPWFTRDPLTLTANTPQSNTVDLGIIRLPTYQAPQPFTVAAYGDDVGKPAVANALVRALTGLTPQADGTTRYLRDGLTDAQGTTSLSLIPGMVNAGRPYDVAVIPPAGTPYGSVCVSRTAVAGQGQLPDIKVPRRQRLTGTVRAAGGASVSGVTVTASLDPATAPPVCAATGPTSTAAPTDALGAFEMLLDPGTYQLDFDPPTGSAAPRHTELKVQVSADVTQQVPQQIDLPVGAVIEGTLRDANLMPLPYATVRIFEPQCKPNPNPDAGADAGDAKDGGSPVVCSPPLLRGETLSDAMGNYRVVVAGTTGN